MKDTSTTPETPPDKAASKRRDRRLVLCSSWGCERNQKGEGHAATYRLTHFEGCAMNVCDDVRKCLTTPYRVEETESEKSWVDPGLPKNMFRKLPSQNARVVESE